MHVQSHDNDLQSWGRIERLKRTITGREVLRNTNAPVLPFGNGRSYGDSCHSDGGVLIDTRSNARIHSFDPQTGILEADAGVLLVDILQQVIPHGYFLVVTPGTSYITIGGAIANDVHGKNHHVKGTFGHYVQSFTLLRSDSDSVFTCSRDENVDLFAATVGGMGLTGVIETVCLRLMKVSSPDIQQKSIRFNHLDDYFDICDEMDQRHEYSVAWIDQLTSGQNFGRGVLMAGDHAELGEGGRILPKPAKLSVPFTPPINLINKYSLSAFNAAYFHKAKAGTHESIAPWQGYFYPLDAIKGWNKLYGPKGLFQHQSVYPLVGGRETTIKLLECAKRHDHASFLTVLKRFGTKKSVGLFSFPREGFTLTLDFANQGARTLKFLRELDEITVEAGGAVNPYKDQRMAPDIFEASFPDWERLENHRDPKFMSNFWQRTAMQLNVSVPA
ncbi:MAG: FAD-binding oxidoreductase [Rhizobiaceae bacterium]|nr:FAD-binding oxidoreductase [Rhizobiaceae bacterium]